MCHTKILLHCFSMRCASQPQPLGGVGSAITQGGSKPTELPPTVPSTSSCAWPDSAALNSSMRRSWRRNERSLHVQIKISWACCCIPTCPFFVHFKDLSVISGKFSCEISSCRNILRLSSPSRFLLPLILDDYLIIVYQYMISIFY